VQRLQGRPEKKETNTRMLEEVKIIGSIGKERNQVKSQFCATILDWLARDLSYSSSEIESRIDLKHILSSGDKFLYARFEKLRALIVRNENR